MSERLRLAIPNGQLEDGVLGVARNIGLEFQEPGREYFVQVQNMPLDFVVLRASDIPSFVSDERSRIQAGITGSDILWEAGYGKDAGIEVPYHGNPDFVPGLFIGMTKDFAQRMKNEQGRFPALQDLAGQMLATKFPNIATSYLEERGIEGVTIERVAGKIEAMQYVWECVGLLDVVESGKTREANKILEIERFYEVTVRMIESLGKMNSYQVGVLEDLKERLYIQLQEVR